MNIEINIVLVSEACWNDHAIAFSVKWPKHNAVRCVCYNNRNVLPSQWRSGCSVMYPFALLAFECIHSMIGTLDIHPVHRACLTLHEIWFLEKCNHGLEDCFLLSRNENDKLVLGGKMFQMSVSSRGYFPHMLSFIVLGVWAKYCWRLWWFSLLINRVLWGQTQHMICSQDELTCSQRRQGDLCFSVSTIHPLIHKTLLLSLRWNASWKHSKLRG